ncbi:MAG: hypothetical protein ACLPX1_03765 [Steroidobacteraceae bacterium]
MVNADGSVSNARLHEQMTEGVNDHDIRMRTRKRLEAMGIPAKVLDSVLPK